MQIITTSINGLTIFEPKVFHDHRGYFFESFNKDIFDRIDSQLQFVQDNEAYSVYGVVRGLHYQLPPFAQGKLIRVVQGKIKDVVVDLRPGSTTLGQVFSIDLDDITKKQLWIPPGFAHGYSVLSPTATIAYKCTSTYNKSAERSIIPTDPQLNIDWGIPQPDIIISDKDLQSPNFGQHSAFE